ncbi:MAG: MFS transporter [Deltaproteobacteria bacterium]|nr:MFS transporter [Deltaproteobacteria bacterium]
MVKNRGLLTSFIFLSMFFLGVGITIIGAAARNIGLDPSQIGLLIAVQNLGFMAALMISGPLADTLDKTKILLIGSLLLSLSFFAFYLKDTFSLNLMVMILMGMGIGTYEGVTDPLLLDIHRGREGLFISINHFFVTFGCLMITVYLLFLQMNWRRAIYQAALAVFLLAVCFTFSSLKTEKKTAEPFILRLRFLIRQKAVLILFLATVCASGLEMCLIGMMTTFLMELRNHSQVTSKVGLILFLSGIGLGRLLVGFFTRRERILELIMMLFGLSTLFLSGLLFVQTESLTYGLIVFSGIAIAALFPLLIAYGGILYKTTPGTVLGIIKLALPLGGILLPLALSFISEHASLEMSLWMFPAIACSGFLILFLNRNTLKSR